MWRCSRCAASIRLEARVLRTVVAGLQLLRQYRPAADGDLEFLQAEAITELVESLEQAAIRPEAARELLRAHPTGRATLAAHIKKLLTDQARELSRCSAEEQMRFLLDLLGERGLTAVLARPGPRRVSNEAATPRRRRGS